METLLYLIGIAVLAVAVYFAYKKQQRQKSSEEIRQENNRRMLLEENVTYFRRLNEKGKELFDRRITQFLNNISIVGVDTTVNDKDRILIAASAVIPVFAFPTWQYHVLDEVIVYPDNFNENFETTGPDRYFRGLVGFGYLSGKLLISRTALYEGFLDYSDGRNTCLHEFIHLIDKEDGEIDGIPQTLMPHQYAIPWLFLIKREIAKINAGTSDIHPYATKNNAEFLSVIAEYFFEKPDKFEAEHPELFTALKTIFRQPLPRSNS